jgi:hypothetical protein
MRTPKLRTLTLALAAGVVSAILLPAGAANAISPCMADPPPDWCFQDPPPTTAPTPTAPTNLALTSVLQTSVTLQWTDNSTNETHWRVRRDMVVGNTSTTTYFQPASATTASTGTTSWTDTTASPSAYVYYWVQAVNADPSYDVPSYSSQIGPMSGTTKPQPANAYAGIVTGPYDESSTQLWLHGTAYDWDTTGPIQVLVWHDGVAQPTLTANAYSSGFNAANPGYGDYHGFSTTIAKSPVKGTHQVCVQPVNVGGGTASGQSCRTYTVYGPPSAATNVTVTVGTTSVTVKFKDNANDETNWYLQRSTDGQVSWYQVGSAYAPIAGTGGTGTAIDYSTPASGTCYRILMVNSYGATPSVAACTP